MLKPNSTPSSAVTMTYENIKNRVKRQAMDILMHKNANRRINAMKKSKRKYGANSPDFSFSINQR